MILIYSTDTDSRADGAWRIGSGRDLIVVLRWTGEFFLIISMACPDSVPQADIATCSKFRALTDMLVIHTGGMPVSMRTI